MSWMSTLDKKKQKHPEKLKKTNKKILNIKMSTEAGPCLYI